MLTSCFLGKLYQVKLAVSESMPFCYSISSTRFCCVLNIFQFDSRSTAKDKCIAFVCLNFIIYKNYYNNSTHPYKIVVLNVLIHVEVYTAPSYRLNI